MNILHLVQHFKIGGLEKMAVTLMQKSRYANTSLIVSLEGNDQEAIEQWPALSLFKQKLICLNKAPKFDRNVIKQLSDIIDEYNIQVIHSHHIGPMLYAGLACIRNKQVKHVSTIHDAWYLQDFKQRLITKGLNILTKIHWVADAKVVANDFYNMTSISADKTILNGIDFEQFTGVDMQHARTKFHLPSDKILIGCAARLEPGKGHLELINLLPSLPQNINFVFAGSGSLISSLMKHALNLEVLERINFLGNVQEMHYFYSAINIMCLYSEREGLPLSILEAMACGKAIVATDVGGISEVVSSKQGVLVNFGDNEALKLALLDAINLEDKDSIRNYIIALADAKTMSDAYDNFYNAISA